MLKQYLFLLMGIGLIGMLSLGGSYTAPTYNSVNFSMCSEYTAPLYNSVNFTMKETYSCITDTCTCAGIDTNWEVDMSDFCIITDACDLGTGKLSFTGTGNFTCDALINTTNLGDPGSNNIIWINDGGIINVK